MPRIPAFSPITSLFILLLLLAANNADEPEVIREPAANTEPTSQENNRSSNFNLEQPTMGGKQFWTDLRVQRGWRIQQNILTHHCRLLDNHDRRQAWGSLDDCQATFNQLVANAEIPPEKGRVVIVLHGLGRTRGAMQEMCDYLEKHYDCTAINVSYASTRDTVANHAKALRQIIEQIGPEVREIDFVAHSLGNIVIRHYLHDASVSKTGQSPDPRIHRIVMLGPPNNGTALAERFKDNPLFRMLWGKSGIQLATEFSELEKHLATPTCEFGIVAGGNEKNDGLNPLLDGDNDFIVTVEEARLEGCTDFHVLPVLHSFLMDDPRVQQKTITFLQQGHF